MATATLVHANAPSSETSEADEAIFAQGRELADPGLTADSQPQPGAPQGKLTKARHVGRSINPGVARDYWVYVPAQYDAARPANLLVVQDARFYLAGASTRR